jgi:hypothetical protein
MLGRIAVAGLLYQGSRMTDELIAALVRLAGNVAETVAGAPNDAVEDSLSEFFIELQDQLGDAFGPDVSELVMAEFTKTVAICKAEIEAAERVTLQ